MDKVTREAIEAKLGLAVKKNKEKKVAQKGMYQAKIEAIKKETKEKLKTETTREKKALAQMTKETKAAIQLENKTQKRIQKALHETRNKTDSAMLKAKLQTSVMNAGIAKVKHNSAVLAKAAKLKKDANDVRDKHAQLEKKIKFLESELEKSITTMSADLNFGAAADSINFQLNDPTTYSVIMAEAEELLMHELLKEVPKIIKKRFEDEIETMKLALKSMMHERHVQLKQPVYTRLAQSSDTMDILIAKLRTHSPQNKTTEDLQKSCDFIIKYYNTIRQAHLTITQMITRPLPDHANIRDFYAKNIPDVLLQGDQVMQKLVAKRISPHQILPMSAVTAIQEKLSVLYRGAHDLATNPWHPKARPAETKSQFQQSLDNTRKRARLDEEAMIQTGVDNPDIMNMARNVSAQAMAPIMKRATNNTMLRGGADVLSSEIFMKPVLVDDNSDIEMMSD